MGSRNPTILSLGSIDEYVMNQGGAHIVQASPTARDVLDMVKLADAVILHGGGDVNPELYGQKRDQSVYGVDYARDQAEVEVVETCLAQGIPMMGICRGMQMINVVSGGSLIQDIEHFANPQENHFGWTHGVYLNPESRLGEAMYPVVSGRFLSYHHQAVDVPGRNLVPIAWGTDDSVVEAYETHEGAYILGVQFHPEMDAARQANSRKVLHSFIKTVARDAGLSSKPVHRHKHKFSLAKAAKANAESRRGRRM